MTFSLSRLRMFLFVPTIVLLIMHGDTVLADDADASAKKLLIIHADDAGMSHSVNRGTIDAMEHGVVSSASIMVPCPWFNEFADYCRKHPDGDYGIHLTLNSEWEHYRWGPVAPRDQVPSLQDEDGYLWDNVPQVAKHVKASEANVELRAQIERALEAQVPLSHLDTHMGAVVARPDLLEVYIQLGIDYQLPVLFVREMDRETIDALPEMAKRRAEIEQLLASRGLPVIDRLYQFYGGDSHQERRETYLNLLRTLKPGVNQLIIHCGYDNEELKAITSSSSRRDGDRRVFSDPAVKALIEREQIEITDWRSLRLKPQ